MDMGRGRGVGFGAFTGLYRFFTADDYRRTLPSRPLALAAVDWVRLSEENDMGMQDWKKLVRITFIR